ncbi:MAG: NAD-dependent succinate-semialdehyde dehydrogenase [Flavobacteriales bacterium]|nr:NAD-dependent succinate-semialdehyde dehydrogenase [Flavobacteriales bacterium]
MIRSINPFSGEMLGEYSEMSLPEAHAVVERVAGAQAHWRNVPLNARCLLVKSLASILREKSHELSPVLTGEMGKPISQSRAEIEKCAWLCDYYADHFEELLTPRVVDTDASRSYVSYEPLGVVFGIMPWNYPFWQVFRFMIPALLSGNGVVLKHASNVTGSALMIHTILRQSGFPEDIMNVVIISGSKSSELIANQHINAVTLTGSEGAGRAVASAAGKAIKPVVLELGGSNAFIVLDDAHIQSAVHDAIVGRFQNNGQSCIAAKRILLHTAIEDQFMALFSKAVRELWVGNPLDESCYIGPLARPEFVDDLQDQVDRSVAAGAKLVVGGRSQGNMFSPTILTGMKQGMAGFDEETFGPVACVGTFNTLDEAIHLANATPYGLGVSIYTQNTERIEPCIKHFKDGAVFVNSILKSDPRLPFGGTGISGFGRELGEEGALAFVNRKTVYFA